MTAYDGLMALGAVVLLGIIAVGFWKSHLVKPIEQPDNFPPVGP